MSVKYSWTCCVFVLDSIDCILDFDRSVDISEFRIECWGSWSENQWRWMRKRMASLGSRNKVHLRYACNVIWSPPWVYRMAAVASSSWHVRGRLNEVGNVKCLGMLRDMLSWMAASTPGWMWWKSGCRDFVSVNFSLLFVRACDGFVFPLATFVLFCFFCNYWTSIRAVCIVQVLTDFSYRFFRIHHQFWDR